MDKQKLYTMGYTLFSGRNGIDTDKMFETLRIYKVSYLADVRSIPFSKQYPQCNSNCLKSIGARFSVSYIHIPELGAKASPEQDVFSKAMDIFFDDIFPIAASKRPEKIELRRDEEIVDFNKFRNDEFFLQGIKRIENAYDKNYTLALMCSEKDPINCHRYFLVSRKIEQVFGEWIEVEHIIKSENGEIVTITNKELDKLLSDTIFKKEEVKKMNLLEKDMFSGEAKIDNYFGKDYQEKIHDFCDRYWNLMHGWKNLAIITIINLKNMIRLFNIGFTQKTAEEFFGVLKKNKINCLVDIRLNPNGQLSRFAFEKDLPFFLDKLVDGCKYAHRVDLAPKSELLKEVRSKGSAMSKDYKVFEKAFNAQLERDSKISNFVEQFGKFENVVLLCSEPTTEKCHRRLVSDMLLKKFGNEIKFGGNL